MKNKITILILSILSSFLVIIYKFFEWDITNVISPFLSIFLWLLIIVFFIVITILTIIKKQWILFLIHLIAILLLFTIPFSEIEIDSNFKANNSIRLDVVKLVEDGSFKPSVNGSNIINLPKKYKSASQDGIIVLNENDDGEFSILFITYRGILDSFSGFVYSPSNSKPSQGDFYGHFTEVKKIGDNWFFVISR